MAIDSIVLELIKPFLKDARVLSLAYADIVVPVEEAERVLQVKVSETTNHGKAHKKGFPLPETISTLKAAGALEVTCIDVFPSRGCEKVLDLNNWQSFRSEYDVVLNAGTIEHCFDIATAMFNAWRAVKLGGVIIHVAPCTMLNHGFWNISPTVYPDFAEANGGKVEALDVRWKGVSVPFDPRARCAVPWDSVLYCVMRKTEMVERTNPVQWKYRR